MPLAFADAPAAPSLEVTFLVENQAVYATRAHLAARSEHFRALFYGGMRESRLGTDLPKRAAGGRRTSRSCSKTWGA